MKVISSMDGLTAKPVNPFGKCNKYQKLDNTEKKYHEFDKSHPSLPITHLMPRETVFEANIVTQYANEDADYFIGWQDKPLDDCGRTRKAYKPDTTPIKEVANEEKAKDVRAVTYQQLLTLPWNKEFGHLLKPGYDNQNGDYDYFGTDPKGKRIIQVNASYCGMTYVKMMDRAWRFYLKVGGSLSCVNNQ